jgi:uncharacterized membrane protein YphA (DoxX/SURF4 family)
VKQFRLIVTSFLFLIILGSFNLHAASAHEVYVLDHSEVQADLVAPQLDFMRSIGEHLEQFSFWGGVVLGSILIIFFISISHPLERFCRPWLLKAKRYAPHVAQVTLGMALLASGYYHAIFGVELPLDHIFGQLATPISYLLMLIGSMLIVGFFPRIAAILATSLFLGLVWNYGAYMLNYATYLGEALTLALFGGAHTLFASKKLGVAFTRMIPTRLHEYKFLIMRALFGASLIYASLYAKFFHGALALDVVTKYNLTHYFPFDPIFLVLGAMIIEILIGLFFLLGFEIRFISVFFLAFLSASLMFFGEAVWPHIILIGTAVAMFLHGYDRYTLSVVLEKNKHEEPVL